MSAPADLLRRADERAKALGYANFSQYIQALILSDVRAAGTHIREEAPPYRVRSQPKSS